MHTKEIISSIYVHVAQDSSAFILLHEHSKVGLFKITYTNCPGKRLVRESDCPGNVRYPEVATVQAVVESR